MRSTGPINGEWYFPRLLVVDDNPLNQRLAERVLVKMNYCVDVVSNGAEAVAAATDRDYLAILMDCKMPVMDGFDATRRIRQLPGMRGQTSIIAMTAYDTPEDRLRCIDAGMNAFAAKPVDWSRVEVLLRNTVTNGGLASTRPESDLTVKQAWRDHVVLNLDVLAQAIGEEGEPEQIAELIAIFRAQATELFDRLGLALASGDAVQSHALCTDLRGTVSSVGAERLAHLMSNVGLMIEARRFADAVGSADSIWDELSQVLVQLDASISIAS